jgi:TonB family protein
MRMRHFESPLRLAVIVFVTSFVSGQICAQSFRGPAENSDKILIYPTCVSCPAPSSTHSERLHHVEGVVILEAVITERGTAEHIEIVKGLDTGLADGALATVRHWRFKPAIGKDGKPMAARIPIMVAFGLKKGHGIGTG